MGRFGDEATRVLWEGQETKATRRAVPANLHRKARRLVSFALEAERPGDCAVFPDFKMLRGRLRGWYQFRVGGPYRLRFQWEDGQAVTIKVGNFHDED